MFRLEMDDDLGLFGLEPLDVPLPLVGHVPEGLGRLFVGRVRGEAAAKLDPATHLGDQLVMTHVRTMS